MVIITPFQEKKKQRYLILIIIIALLGTIFLVWYKFYLPKHTPTPRISSVKKPRIDINFDILKSPILTNEETGLKAFEGIPWFNPEDAGRSNPFQPY